MSKKRRPRVALGLITRADGVRVEVKSPTVWKLLNEQAGRLEAQHQLLEGLKGSLTKLEAERDEARGQRHMYRLAFDDLAENWWVNLGAWLGLVRLRDLRVVATARPAAGDTEMVSPLPAAAAPVAADSPATA